MEKNLDRLDGSPTADRPDWPAGLLVSAEGTVGPSPAASGPGTDDDELARIRLGSDGGPLCD